MEVTSLLYQFLVGGVVFAVGIAVPWRAGDYSLKNRGGPPAARSPSLAAALFYLAPAVGVAPLSPPGPGRPTWTQPPSLGPVSTTG